MLAAALPVWLALVVGLRLLSGGGAWELGWPGAIGLGTVLWPAFLAGYVSLKRIFGSAEERDDELAENAWMVAAFGFPTLLGSFLFSFLVLGIARFMQSFKTLPSGGVANFVMSVLALHVLAWVLVGALQWGWSAWREARD